jgi:hypothetical protein
VIINYYKNLNYYGKERERKEDERQAACIREEAGTGWPQGG